MCNQKSLVFPTKPEDVMCNQSSTPSSPKVQKLMCNRNLSNGDSCTLRLRPGWVKASLTFSHSEARHAGHHPPPHHHHHHHHRHRHEFVHMVELQNVIFFKLSNNFGFLIVQN